MLALRADRTRSGKIRLRPALAVCLAVVAVLVGGCGEPVPGGPPPNRPSLAPETGSAEASATPSVTAGVDAAAKPGQCFDHTSTDHLVIDATEPFVSCARPHNARTVYVGELTDPDVLSFAEAQPLQAAASQPGGLETLPADLQKAYTGLIASMEATRVECARILDDTIGVALPSGVRQATVLTTDLTGPTRAQWDAGDRWVRCNVVARIPPDSTGPERLLPFAPDLVNSLDDATYRPCWVGDPTGPGIPCAEGAGDKDAWVTIADRVPTPATPWPGESAAQDAATALCREVVRQAGAAPMPDLLASGRSIAADGTETSGFTAQTWGTPAATISCAIPLSQFTQ